MSNSVGYVLASPMVYTRRTIYSPGEEKPPDCKPWWKYRTGDPVCVPSRSSILADTPQREPDGYFNDVEESTGAVRLSPLHYFRDCPFLAGGRRRPRPDATVLEVSLELLNQIPTLGSCKRCMKRLSEAAAVQESCTPTEEVANVV